MAQRLADLGYAVLLPNPYYRLGPYDPFLRTVLRAPDALARLMAMARTITQDDVIRDTKAILSFLAKQPEVTGHGSRRHAHSVSQLARPEGPLSQ